MLTVSGTLDAIAFVFENLLEQTADNFVVVNDEDRREASGHRSHLPADEPVAARCSETTLRPSC
jgi:hypothetical protein